MKMSDEFIGWLVGWLEGHEVKACFAGGAYGAAKWARLVGSQ